MYYPPYSVSEREPSIFAKKQWLQRVDERSAGGRHGLIHET